MKCLLTAILVACGLWGAPVVKTVCASGCDYSNLQTAINAAARGWILELKAGENFDTSNGFTLPAKSGAGWIVLRSSKLAELPAGKRVGPSDVSKLATLRVTAGGYNPVIKTTGAPSSHWRLQGLEITLSTSNLQSTANLVILGDTDLETSPEKISHHFVIDRCYIHGLPDDSGPWRAVLHNADHVTISNSYLSEVKLLAAVAESQVLCGWSLNGHLTVRNNYIAGAAINSLVGGAAPAVRGVVPMFLSYLGNLYEKPGSHQIARYEADPAGTALPTTGTLGGGGPVSGQTFWKTDTAEFYGRSSMAWYKLSNVGSTEACLEGAFWRNESASPSYWECVNGNWQSRASDKVVTGVGGAWTGWGLKNLFELKHVLGARVEGNLMQNTFFPTFGGQVGATVLLNWTEDQNGAWSTIRDVAIRNNKFRRVATGIVQGNINRIGTVTSAGPGTPTQLTCSAGCNQGGAATRWVRIAGATDQWAGINGDWLASFSDASSFTIGYDSTGHGSLTGTVKVHGQYIAMAHTHPRRITVENNLWESLAVAPNYTMSAMTSDFGSGGYSYTMGRGTLLQYPQTAFQHNTMIKPHVDGNWRMGVWTVPFGSNSADMRLSNNLIEAGDHMVMGYSGGGGCDYGLTPYWAPASWVLARNVVVQTGQLVLSWLTSAYDRDCLDWAWPWQRQGTGVRSPVTGASVAADAANCGTRNRLTIQFSAGHGLFPKTPFKVTAAQPYDVVGSYETPQLRLGTSNLVSQYDTAIEVCTSAPPGTYTGVTVEASADFQNYGGKNFRLASTSQYKHWATDGSDPGANQDVVEWATEYAESGQDNPYLDFGVKTFLPAPQGGEFRWTSYSEAACTWTISPTRAFATSVGAVSQSRAGRYGVATVSGLSPATAYWYKITCEGGRYRDGEFATTP